MKILHHHHRAEIALNRLSTLTEVEVEVVMQAKDEVMVVLTKIKTSNNRISLMMDKGPMYVEEEIREAGGVKEVAEIFSETMLEMITENVGIVVEQVITKMSVHLEVKVRGDSRAIMHLPAEIQMTRRGYL